MKSPEWTGPASGARAHVWLGTTATPLVLVGYVWYDEGEDPIYVTSENDRSGGNDELVAEAFENLEQYHTDFEVVEAGAGRILVSAGRPFAAERVMCESHMLLAHEKLDSSEILISVARRGAVLVCALDCSNEVKQTMIGLHAESWDNPDALTDRIVDDLVVMRAGTVTGMIPIGRDPEGRPKWGSLSG